MRIGDLFASSVWLYLDKSYRGTMVELGKMVCLCTYWKLYVSGITVVASFQKGSQRCLLLDIHILV